MATISSEEPNRARLGRGVEIQVIGAPGCVRVAIVSPHMPELGGESVVDFGVLPIDDAIKITQLFINAVEVAQAADPSHDLQPLTGATVHLADGTLVELRPGAGFVQTWLKLPYLQECAADVVHLGPLVIDDVDALIDSLIEARDAAREVAHAKA